MDAKITWWVIARIVLKAALFFILINVMWALLDPLPALSRASIHRFIAPRERLPFNRTTSSETYNVAIFDLDATLASHAISRPKSPDEFRVVLVGDSSVWGAGLAADETLAAQISQLELETHDERRVVAYNLGFPGTSITKDMLIVSRMPVYEPDLIVWLITPRSLFLDIQFDSPIVSNHPDEVEQMIVKYRLPLDAANLPKDNDSLTSRTILGQRRSIANVIRLNIYGVMWAATKIDEVDPRESETESNEDIEGGGAQSAIVTGTEVDTLRMISAGIRATGDVPIMVVNEPIAINPNIRSGEEIPQWAVDYFVWEKQIVDRATIENWDYVDLSGALPNNVFQRGRVHRLAEGEHLLARIISPLILARADS